MLSDILKTCLNIRKNEVVLIVTDDDKLNVAAELESAARQLSNEVLAVKMKPRSHHAEEPPEAVASAMRSADVVIAPTTMSLTHTDARKKACEAGARVATMPGITMEMLREGALLADYNAVKKRTDKIARLLTKAREIRIETSLGSDFRASLRGRKGIADSGIFTKKGAFGNLPAGEAFIAPVEGSSSGILVFDGSFSSIGVLKEPLKLQIKKGKVVSCERMMQVLKKYKNASNVAEIGIGTNEKARLTGNVLEDEKVFGTAHIALGDNHTFGGRTRAEIHLDGIIKKPNLWLDGRQIMREGELIVHLKTCHSKRNKYPVGKY